MYLLSQADGYKYPSRDEVYVVGISPLNAGLAAIASDQSLSLFNPSSLSQGPLRRIETNHGNLTCGKTYNAVESIMCTTGETGTISLWDLRLDASQAQVLQLQGTT